MKNINTLIEEASKTLEFALSERLADYCESSDYVCDAINEIIDADYPCYYSELIKWFKDTPNSEEYINDAAREFGIDSKNFDIFKVIGCGWCEWAREQIEAEREEALYLAALCFVRDNMKREEITDEQAEAIEDIYYKNIDTFIDLQNELNTIFEIEG